MFRFVGAHRLDKLLSFHLNVYELRGGFINSCARFYAIRDFFVLYYRYTYEYI